MRNITYVLLALCLLVRLVGAQTPKSYSYQILYTGRTLGYARIPAEQTLPENKDGSRSEAAQKFLDQFKSAEKSGIAQFRIAMGDNFSPDLFGRSIRLQTPAPACDGPNSLYSATTRSASFIPSRMLILTTSRNSTWLNPAGWRGSSF
jgi:hypothetical protein